MTSEIEMVRLLLTELDMHASDNYSLADQRKDDFPRLDVGCMSSEEVSEMMQRLVDAGLASGVNRPNWSRAWQACGLTPSGRALLKVMNEPTAWRLIVARFGEASLPLSREALHQLGADALQ